MSKKKTNSKPKEKIYNVRIVENETSIGTHILGFIITAFISLGIFILLNSFEIKNAIDEGVSLLEICFNKGIEFVSISGFSFIFYGAILVIKGKK